MKGLTNLLVIFIGFALAVYCEQYSGEKETFKLDEFLNATFYDRKWNGTWVNGESFMYKKDDDYYLYNVNTNKSSIFLPKKTLEKFSGATIKVSEDQSTILVKYNIVTVYRHSTLADYAIISLSSGQTTSLSEAEGTKYQLCQLLPKDNAVVYVKDNNIYYKPKDTAPAVKITTNGEPGVIYNGVPDWVYEEEVLLGDSALWTSPTGEALVYATFTDTEVPEFSYYKYGTPGSMDSQYPTVQKIKYPKAGANNPQFSLHSYNFATKKHANLNLGFTDVDSVNYIIYDVTWKDSTNVFVTYTNRIQNEGKLLSCNVNTGTCTDVDTFKKTNGWLEVHSPLSIEDDLIQHRTEDEFDNLKVITKTGNVKNVTIGNKTITKIYGYSGSMIYFEGTDPIAHSQQHVYEVDYVNNKEPICHTCKFETPEGNCTFAKADFSKDMSSMTRICMGPGPTFIDIVKTNTQKTLVNWERNEEVRLALTKKAMPIIKDMKIKIKSTNFDAAVRLILPYDFTESKQYPMMVNVYAGPNSNQISDAYAVGLESYLVSSKQYIYALIDGRGSGKRGRTLMQAVYKNLGGFEIDDQINTAKELRDTLKYIDPKKIGIWGWSYGGFATAWAIAKDNEGVFSCGVSVAPVTDYIYYDSIYTERYMDLPKNNQLGYVNTDVTSRAESFRYKNFLLVHGNADDNVHYQQSMMLARALELADVPFQQISYPDEDHSLGHVQRHLYHALDAFWDEHLLKLDPKNGVQHLMPSVTYLISLFFVVRLFH